MRRVSCRAARWIKHAEQAHLLCPWIFEAMTLSGRQVNARACRKFAAFVIRPHDAAALQNVDGFFVGVKVAWCAARRNDAQKLRDAFAAEVFVNQQVKRTISGQNRGAVGFVNDEIARIACLGAPLGHVVRYFDAGFFRATDANNR